MQNECYIFKLILLKMEGIIDGRKGHIHDVWFTNSIIKTTIASKEIYEKNKIRTTQNSQVFKH